MEVIPQALLLSGILWYWIAHSEKKWLNLVLGIAFFFSLVLTILGLLLLSVDSASSPAILCSLIRSLGTVLRNSVSFVLMNRRSLIPIVPIFLLLLFSGCSGYIQRMVTQSLGRIGEPIPSPPQMITTPILPNANLAVGWVGHATVLIQIHDKLFITDPLFTNTIGMLVERFVKPGLDPAILTKIDFTLISHMHFDHFSFGSLEEIPKNGILVVANGLAAYTPEFGFKETVMLQSWQSIEDDSVRITAVPVQHFSGRYGFDRTWLGETGYTGYIIEYKGIVVFFAGDTGYNPELFKEIGRRFKIDLALIPISPGGAGLGSHVHASPLGAVKIFEDVGAKYMMPIHYGTMAYGSPPDAAERLEALHEAAKQEGVADRVIALQVGEQRVVF